MPSSTPIIALVDDDQNISTSLGMTLKAEGFEVIAYPDGQAGYDGICAAPPDLAVLDVKMPKMDGLELLQKLRESIDTQAIPIIMLTSKDDEVDELMGFRLGADDYVTKPFSQKLLIARIRALLQRSELQAATPTITGGGEIEPLTRGHLLLDDARHLCAWKDQPLNLTVTEYLLVKVLASRPGHVKTRDQLIDAAYGDHIYVEDRTIDSHIKRIRKKFKKIDENFERIETLYGVGYKYNDAESI